MNMVYKYIADPQEYRLEISRPGLRFVVIYVRPVREFLVSVQQPKRSQSGLSSLLGQSHVNALKKKRNGGRYELMPV